MAVVDRDLEELARLKALDRIRRASALMDEHQAAVGKLADVRALAMVELREKGMPASEIAGALGISRQQVHRLLNSVNDQPQPRDGSLSYEQREQLMEAKRAGELACGICGIQIGPTEESRSIGMPDGQLLVMCGPCGNDAIEKAKLGLLGAETSHYELLDTTTGRRQRVDPSSWSP